MAKSNDGRKVKINEDAKIFAKITIKKYKKQNGDYFDSKKELKNSYFMYLVDLLPETINFVIKSGYLKDVEDVQETKTAILQKINDPDFIKCVKREIKDGNKIKNIKLLPIIIKEILMEGKRVNDAALAADPNAKIYDMTDLVELSKLILKKKMKKMEEAGIPTTVAFDALSIIPNESALESSQFYRIKMLFEALYEHSKTTNIPFEEIMNIIVGSDYYPVFITFALLERKEKFSKLTDNQKNFYLDISNWCFKTMEKDLNKDEVEGVIKTYVSGRRKDEARGKDGNRRYALASLPSDEYPRITKVINKMISEDSEIKKYL